MAELRVNIHSLVLNGPHIGGSVKAAKKLMARTLKVKESEAKEAMTYEGSYSGTPEQKVLAWCGAGKTLAPCLYYKRSFCQDRLGTTTRKRWKQRRCVRRVSEVSGRALRYSGEYMPHTLAEDLHSGVALCVLDLPYELLPHFRNGCRASAARLPHVCHVATHPLN
jgi:hypothetical protein